MNITLTGSLGHIGLPLTKELVQKGHQVTVISSTADRKKDIEALGATAAIGSIEDTDFLIQTFKGADAVYCMLPPAGFKEPDRLKFYSEIAAKYAEAIRKNGIKRVVHLSSFGAHLPSGTGIIVGAYKAEQILNGLSDVYVTHVRPTYFYYNLDTFIGMIKHAGVMKANYGADDKILLVAPEDIAAVIAEELQVTSGSQSVRYIASDERTANEIASVIGAAVGKPDLKWIITSSEEMRQGMEAHGLPPIFAAGLIEMYESHHAGRMQEDYYAKEPVVKGKVKLEDYLPAFIEAYNKQ